MRLCRTMCLLRTARYIPSLWNGKRNSFSRNFSCSEIPNSSHKLNLKNLRAGRPRYDKTPEFIGEGEQDTKLRSWKSKVKFVC